MTVILVACFASFVSGLMAAAGTEVLMGRDRARNRPGGSFAVGVVIGLAAMLAFNGGVLSLILSLLFGLVGWLIYRFLAAAN